MIVILVYWKSPLYSTEHSVYVVIEFENSDLGINTK